MRTSYNEKDVKVLLKDITGLINPMNSEEREKEIQNGKHYSELLPVEYKPTEEYFRLFYSALKNNAKKTALSIEKLAENIWSYKNGNVVLVSFARAGTPVGILIKRYLEKKYSTTVPHYTVSIIRDKGIDKNAINYILERHNDKPIQFVDGWVGKGAINKELDLINKDFPNIDRMLAVISDPAGITSLCGTREDFLIPCACLNAPVSGLFSRTVLNSELIGKEDFHGSVYYEEMKSIDVSYEFIENVEKYFTYNNYPSFEPYKPDCKGILEVQNIAKKFGVKDINFIKPGIGETTRVLLRRTPRMILVKDMHDILNNIHILELCKEKNIKILEYPLLNYNVCGIIKNISDI